MSKWINARDCVPLEDGYYLIQSVFGSVSPICYTHEGGWNTYYKDNGQLAGHRIEDEYVARWLKAEAPKPIPDEWLTDYMERGNRCATE